MRWLKLANLVVLFCFGTMLAAANIWISAMRSTIPLQLDARVVRRETGAKKHPGKDDVFLLQLDPSRWLQVDRRVHDAINDGDVIRKASWSRQLEIGAESIALDWSKDFYGMIIAMPAIVLVLLVTSTLVWWQGHRRSAGTSAAQFRQ